MKKNKKSTSAFFLLVATLFLVTGCTPESPEKIFEKTVLNTNMLTKFGSMDIHHLLKETPEVYDASQKKMVPSSYEDYFKFKISYLEQAEESIKKIKLNEDNKEIVTASLGLFAYVIPREKEGYIQIAKLKDQKASEDVITNAIIAFDAAHSKEANEKFETLITIAKAYAQKHNLDAKFF
ncbi:hypothetical protein [Flavobacterium sp. FlaQc-48]|uniref:hypothetical protein n=1 Tax=Flavobacterium sp. FlaQc-48 TaxID=3374181 RepID=UPI003756CA00